MSATAKIFQHGRSQAVRLPKEFRLPGKEVKVSRIGNAVLLEPVDAEDGFNAEGFFAKIDAIMAGAKFPYVTDEDLHPELDQPANFDD